LICKLQIDTARLKTQCSFFGLFYYLGLHSNGDVFMVFSKDIECRRMRTQADSDRKYNCRLSLLQTKAKLHSKSSYFTAIGSSSMKTVADKHRHAAYHNKHWRRAFGGIIIDDIVAWSRERLSMTLNDLEPPNKRF